MKKHGIIFVRMSSVAIMALFICFFAQKNFAMTHVIMFGGSLGFMYSPNSLNASIGDTIKWEGSFSTHPLSSTTIPTGAASWHNATGTTFSYVITKEGMYHYQCDVHVSLGMVGTITVVATSINGDRAFQWQKSSSMNIVTRGDQNIIRFSIPNNGNVNIDLFGLDGRKVVTILNKPFSVGSHQTVIGPLPVGIYCLKLSQGGNSVVRSLQIIK
jgi:plastocyanin